MHEIISIHVVSLNTELLPLIKLKKACDLNFYIPYLIDMKFLLNMSFICVIQYNIITELLPIIVIQTTSTLLHLLSLNFVYAFENKCPHALLQK